MRSDTEVSPLDIQVPFQEFVKLYRLANLSQSDIDFLNLYKVLQPAFILWQKVWVSQNYISNVNISSLINILIKDDSPSGSISWKLNTYNEYLRLNNLTLLDELNYCLVQHIRKDKHIYDHYYEEKNLLFFIAKDIKMFLFKKIRRVLANYKRCGDFSIKLPKNTKYYDVTLDTSYIQNNKLAINILFLLTQQVQVNDILSMLSISHKRYKEIIECLLQNLKQLNK